MEFIDHSRHFHIHLVFMVDYPYNFFVDAVDRSSLLALFGGINTHFIALDINLALQLHAMLLLDTIRHEFSCTCYQRERQCANDSYKPSQQSKYKSAHHLYLLLWFLAYI